MYQFQKLITLSILLLQLPFFLSAQEIQSKVTAVTIYPYGAKVTRVATLNLPEGASKYVFSNLESGLDPKTIEAELSNDAVNVLSVKGDSGVDYKVENNPELVVVQDSLDSVTQELNWLIEKRNIYTEEEKIVNNNSQLGTDNNNNKTAALKELVLFYRSQLMEIRAKKFDLNKSISNLESRQQVLKKEIKRLKRGKAFNKIELQFSNTIATSTTVEFSYYVKNVSWKAIYDLKAKDTNNPMDLIYRAEIKQNTGVDWTGIQVSLSNAKPARNKKLPKLKTVFATLENQFHLDTVLTFDPETYEEPIHVVRSESPSLMTEEQITRELSTSFIKDVRGLQDIPSNSKPQFLTIQSFQLPTSYQYTCIPKEDLQVYLVAQLSNYGQYHLQSGTANVFFENTYIGKTTIDPYAVSDTLEISLGQDPGISVSRKYRNFNATKVIRNSRKETLNFDIDIRNNKKEAVVIKMLDQIPVSTDKLIEIKLLENSGATVCEDSGELEWLVNVAPNTSEELKFAYSIKYPKDKTVGRRK